MTRSVEECYRIYECHHENSPIRACNIRKYKTGYRKEVVRSQHEPSATTFGTREVSENVTIARSGEYADNSIVPAYSSHDGSDKDKFCNCWSPKVILSVAESKYTGE